MKMEQVRVTARSGFTLMEVSMGATLFAIIAFKAYGAIQSVSETSSTENDEVVLEDQAWRVVRQIGYEIMGANRERLFPNAERPASFDDIRFQANLGLLGGEVVWSDPEEITLEDRLNQVLWRENPDEESERRVVWTNLVAPFLEGELFNGMDDNGNGLIDEKGLSFVLEGDAVTVRLTLERMNDQGEGIVRTVETTVTCRNLTTGADA